MSSLANSVAALAEWEAAHSAASQGLSYSIGGRTLTRENSAEIRANITYYSREVKRYKAKAAGSKRGGFSLASWS